MGQITYIRTDTYCLVEVMDEGNREIDVWELVGLIALFKEQNIEHAEDPFWAPKDTADLDNSIVYFYSMLIEAMPDEPEYNAERLSLCTPLGVVG